ncbi:ATP-binding protein [Salinirubellus salinus]|uniref:histidine kinase n=1 Tax=Salinirubellus salinus TaxID=1364945 RepID=A0A9E7R2R9_9EURY|nr:ATP-binding protein [Salinirubellus salinus]UWM54659.1 ATP-binding protein [Salinirubellus salinus]UWM54729.1 ATP-binding protein [Salinirubellus salinus]
MLSLDRPARVLYVDSYDGVDRAAAAFDPADVDVTYETDPDRALDLVETNRFECAVLGPEPAGGSGIAMLVATREVSDVPVVLLGGETPGPTTAFDAGADEYARPPTDEDTAAALAARIVNLVGRRRAERTATTERARSAALVADEGEFRDLAERLDQVVWIRDPDGAFRYANAAFESTWGVSDETLRDDPSLFERRIHPADRPDAAGFEAGVHEYRVQQADGPVRWLRDHVREVETDEGCRVVGVAEDVTARQRLSRDLEANVEALGRLYEISSNPDLEFEEKAPRLLAVGCDLLDLSFGALMRIEDGSQRVVAAHGTGVEAGLETPLSRAYCRRTIDSDSLLGIRDAPAEGMAGDPAYDEWGFACYLGGKVLVDDELYGTVCFGSEEPRDEPFTAAERSVVELLVQWVSHELTQRTVQERLRRRNERLDDFASVVSHDLRNPLNVVSGRVEMALDASEDPAVVDHLEMATGGIERMEDLIADLLALARHDTSIEPTSVAIADVARGAWQTVPTGDATLTLRDGLGQVQADPPRLRQLFENLFRNAVEHGSTGPDPQARRDAVERSSTSPASQARQDAINHASPPDPEPTDGGNDPGPTTLTDGGSGPRVVVGPLDGGGFYVEDDGPGLPREESVFASGVTTAADGTGLGLAIVKQVAEAHGWSVRAGEAPTGGARFEFAF